MHARQDHPVLAMQDSLLADPHANVRWLTIPSTPRSCRVGLCEGTPVLPVRVLGGAWRLGPEREILRKCFCYRRASLRTSYAGQPDSPLALPLSLTPPTTHSHSHSHSHHSLNECADGVVGLPCCTNSIVVRKMLCVLRSVCCCHHVSRTAPPIALSYI